MGIVIRQSFWSTVSAYIGVGIGYLNAVILMPLFMEPEDIGLMRVVMSIALMLTTFATFGTTAMIVRFFPIYHSSSKVLNQLFTLALIIILGSFTLLTTTLHYFSQEFFAFFQNKSPEVGNYLGLIIILIFQMTLFNLLEAILRSRKQIILSNVTRDLIYKILHIVTVILYGLNVLAFDQYLFGHSIIYIVLIMTLLIPLVLNYGLRLDLSLSTIGSNKKGLLKYASISIVSGLGMVIIIQIDQIMVTKYLGLTANGIYSIALFMAAVIELPRKFVAQISTPIIAESIVNNEYDRLEDHYQAASINQLIIGLFIFLLILANLDSIYAIMPNGDKYSSGWWAFVIIGLVRLIDMGFSLNGEILTYSTYFKVNLYAVLVLCIIAVASNIWLIPIFGLKGAALATLQSYLLFNIFKFLFIKSRMGMLPFTKNTVVVISIGLVLGIPSVLLPILWHPIADIIIRSSLLSALFITLTYLSKASPVFNKQVQLILTKALPSIR